jgi:hypothetical protein
MKEKIHYIGWWESGANKAYIQEVTLDKGSDFKGIVIKFGYLSQYTGLRGSKEKGWFRIDNQRILYPKYGVNWEEGDIVLDIKKEIKESSMDIKKIIREEIGKIRTASKIGRSDIPAPVVIYDKDQNTAKGMVNIRVVRSKSKYETYKIFLTPRQNNSNNDAIFDTTTRFADVKKKISELVASYEQGTK